MKNSTEVNTKPTENKISRKEAIKKTGLVALTASSLLFLNTKAHACDSIRQDSQTPTRSGRHGHRHRDRFRHSGDK